MNCRKNTKRTLFNMFEIFTCSGCNNYLIYEYIYIGNNTINIYRFNKECTNELYKFNYLKLFLKEIIINEGDLFLILTKEEYIKSSDYFPLLIDENNLYIFIE